MADRYWVGGTASWDGTAGSKWATTSGGAGGASEPSSTDNVFFDANSGAVTVTVASSIRSCLSINFTGFTGTFAGTIGLNVYGSFTLGSGMTRTYTGTVTFLATTTGHTITLNGIATSSPFTFNGVGGGWTVQDTWDNGTATANTILLTAGSLDTNSQTITTTTMSGSNSNVRALTLGTSTIYIRQNWLFSTGTNLTLSAASATIHFNSTTSDTVNFQSTNQTYGTVIFASNGASWNITAANTFTNLTLTGQATKTTQLNLSGNQTVTGTFTSNGNSLTNRLLVCSTAYGTARTITAATVSMTNTDFRDITGAGAGSWSGTSIGDALGNSGITFTTPVTRYGVVAGNWSDTAMWSATSGGSGGASVPLCHDTVRLDANSGAGTYLIDMPRPFADIDCTGFVQTLSFNSLTIEIYGSVTLVSGMTRTGNQAIRLRGRSSSHTITSAGLSWSNSFTLYAPGGKYTLQDSFTTSGLLSLFAGELDTNSQAVTVLSLGSDASFSIRTLTLGSSVFTVTGTGNVFSLSTGNTTNINAGTSKIVLNNGTTSAKTFTGNGKVFYDVEFTGAGIATYTIVGSNTFHEFKSTKTVAHTFLFTAGTTQTIEIWSVSGTSGNVVTINSTTTATHSLTYNGSAGYVSADYLDIQHSIATPASTWFAGDNSTDNQATATAGSGWIFTQPLPQVQTNDPTNIAVDSADFNGNILDLRGGANPTVRGFKYRTASTGGTPTTEGFESGTLGIFTNDPASKTGWAADSGGTPTSATGPTSGSVGSWYAFIEASNSSNNGDTDIMEAFCGAGSLTFDYHQYGTSQGTLYVDYWNGTTWTNLWSSTGNQGNQWNTGITVGIPVGATKLRFRNVAAGGVFGDVAVDNISVPQYALGTENDLSASGSFGTGAYSLNQNPLTTATFYQVKAYATTTAGTGYGEELYFQTLSLGIQEGEMFLAMG